MISNVVSVVTTFYSFQYASIHWCACVYETSIVVNGATNQGNRRDKIWTLNKSWKGSRCTKLALSGSWIHDLITQSVRTFELDSVAVGSITFRLSFSKSTLKTSSGEYYTYICIYKYIYIYIYIYIIYIYYIYINFKAINNVLDGKMVLKTHLLIKIFRYFTEASSV